jgi:y4mF family transcriptional regulator
MPDAFALRDIAALVKGRRRDLGWTQDRLAREAGVSRKWISEFESGKPGAELQLVLRVLDALRLRLRLDPESDAPVARGSNAVDLDSLLKELDPTWRPEGPLDG